MPVSHLGLTVSHLPSATSFYLAVLAPLGYRFIGQDGNSIGLGIDHADFFLTQEPRGHTISPAHIAFTADSRPTVRDCYAAAVQSGAHPSGAPSYRDRDCTVFNAAVEDLDGNVIEFVHREQADFEEEDVTITPAQDSRVLDWQNGVTASGLHEDTESLGSRTSRAKSRVQTLGELASTASRSVRSRSEAPSPGIRRAATLPVGTSSTTEFPSKAFLGGLLGATAGAALAWAMLKSEGDNARDERAYSAATRSQSSRRASIDGGRSHRNFSITESHAPRSHRNFSVTESAYSRKYPPRSRYPPPSLARSRKAIQQTPYYEEEDEEIHEAIRYASSRRPPAPTRSKTIAAIEYAPQSTTTRRSHSTVKRSSTLPIEDKQNYYLEAPKPTSTASRHSDRHSTRQSVQEDDQDLKRRDSGISMGSHRSHHSHHSRHSRHSAAEGSKASTIKPSRHAPSAANVPLPESKAPSHTSGGRRSSRADSRAQSYVTAAQVPIPESRAGEGYDEEEAAEESDGLGDMKTVVPDDSISCVDIGKLRSSAAARSNASRKSGGSKHGSRRSEAAGSDRTIRASKREKEDDRRSAATLPVRGREDHDRKKRSTFSYA